MCPATKIYHVWKVGFTNTYQIFKGDNLIAELSHDEYLDLKTTINCPCYKPFRDEIAYTEEEKKYLENKLKEGE